MITISLCMIVRDEEAVLGRCLASIADGVDEIIIADTGSEDRTKEIAKSFGAKIYDFPWINDFAAARNFSFSKATMDYILWLDADDLIPAESLKKLLELKKTLPSHADMVMMEYRMGPLEDENALRFYRERLLRRGGGFRWEGAVHEVIAPKGSILYSPIIICHQKEKPRDSLRNLRIYEGKLAKGCKFTPREQYYFGRELMEHQRFSEAVAAFEKALEQNLWIEDRLEAIRLIAECKRAQGDPDGALQMLLSALFYGAPRGELCCAIGDLFLEREENDAAAFWFRSAMECPISHEGFILKDRYGLYPALQLCFCAWKKGRAEEAEQWNERAAQYAPKDPRVQYNREFFASIK